MRIIGARVGLPSCRSLRISCSARNAYPDSFELRRVRTDGTLKWTNEFIYVSEVLTDETVGLEPLDDRYWRLHFGPSASATLTESPSRGSTT